MTERRRKAINLLGFAYLSLLSTWIAVNLFELLALYASGTLAAFVENGTLYLNDFVHFYVAGKIAGSAQSTLAYDWPVQKAFLNQVIAPLHLEEMFYTQSVPFFFVLMVPFSWLPLNLSHLLWDVFTAGFGIWGLLLLGNSNSRLSKKELLFLTVGVTASLPAWLALRFGQTSWFLIGLVSVYAHHFLKGHNWISGIALAISTIKPQYLIFLVAPALAERRYKLLLAFLATEIFLLVLAGLSIGWNNVVHYPQYLFEVDADEPVNAKSMVSIRGLLANVLPQAQALTLSTIVMAVGGVAMVWLLYRWLSRSQSSITAQWAIAVSIVLALVLSPHTLTYDCLLLAVSAMLTLKTLNVAEILELSSFPERVWHVLLLVYPVISWLFFILGGPWQIGVLAMLNVVLAVCGALALSDSLKTAPRG